jgi:hypothetical protein
MRVGVVGELLVVGGGADRPVGGRRVLHLIEPVEAIVEVGGEVAVPVGQGLNQAVVGILNRPLGPLIARAIGLSNRGEAVV